MAGPVRAYFQIDNERPHGLQDIQPVPFQVIAKQALAVLDIPIPGAVGNVRNLVKGIQLIAGLFFLDSQERVGEFFNGQVLRGALGDGE